MSGTSHEIMALLHLPPPDSVAGLLLTFGALSCGVLPRWG